MLITKINLNARMDSPKVLDEVSNLVCKYKKTLYLCEDWYETKNSILCEVLVFDSEKEAIPSERSCSIRNKYLRDRIHNSLMLFHNSK